MTLSELLSTIRGEHGQVTLHVPEDWLQGRTAFGGLQGALALNAMRQLVPSDMALRVFQMTFAAPVFGGEATAEAQVLRAGKNTRHVEARIMQGDQVQAVVVAVFGYGRASSVQRTLSARPLADQQPPRPFPFKPGITPNFTQHFDARWLAGGFPFSGHPDPAIVVDVSLRDTGDATEAHVLALADFVPPVALSQLTTPVPGSSLTWMLEMLTDDLSDLALAHWRIDAEMVAAADGYSSQSVTLWSPKGKAIALSRQSMVVFG